MEALSLPRDRWHEYARLPVAPDDPAVKAWAGPGETIFPGLVAREQQPDTGSMWNGRDGIGTVMRTLILTDRRIIVLDGQDQHETSIALGDVEDASVVSAPGEFDGGSLAEATIEILARGPSDPQPFRWTTGTRDAEVFAEMVRERVGAIERKDVPPGPDGPPPPKTGYTVPVFDDVAEIAPAVPLPNGLQFGEAVIPWSDFERITVRDPGVMTFTLRLGTSSSALFPGWVIRVPDLGDAEPIWRAFIAHPRRGAGRATDSGRFDVVEAAPGSEPTPASDPDARRRS